MVLSIVGPGEGGGRREVIGSVLTRGGPGEPSIWVGDVGHDPMHDEAPQGILSLGGETYHGTTPIETIRWVLELSSVGGGN